MSDHGCMLPASVALLLSLAWYAQPTNAQVPGVLVWGDDTYGQTNVPASATNVVALAAGDNHCLALRADGTIVAWGGNSSGQTNVPSDLTNVVSVAAGSSHSLALRRDGTVALWGIIHPSGVTTVPTGATNVVGLAIGPGAQHALVLKSDGTVLDWGMDYNGLTNIPPTARNVVAVAAGAIHSLALRSDGQAVAWGSNNRGQLNVPASATNIVAIATGWYDNAAIRADGTVLVWGTPTPPASYGFTNIVELACSGDNFINLALLAARRDGTIAEYSASPPSYPTNSISAVAAGSYDGLALIGSGPPKFPGLPANRTVASGLTAYFRTYAVGALPLFYQWRCNGTNIPAATNYVLVLTNVQPMQAGSYYTITASNALGIATNGPILLNEVPLELSIQPQNLSVPAGATATFMATNIVGQGPFIYQWQFNNTNIDSATNNSLSLPNVQQNQSGAYSVVAVNGYGTVTNTAALAVQPLVFDLSSTNLLMTTNGLLLRLDSVFTTKGVILFASTNLVGWLPILTNPPATGSVLFIDSAATNLPQRFYRATEQ